MIGSNVCLRFDQGQEGGDLWFGAHRSDGPLQERHPGPEIQGYPENQKQEVRPRGAHR